MQFVTEELVQKFLLEDEGELSKKINPIVEIETSEQKRAGFIIAYILYADSERKNFTFDDFTVNGADDSIRARFFQEFMVRECGPKYAKALLKREDARHEKMLQIIHDMCNKNSVEL